MDSKQLSHYFVFLLILVGITVSSLAITPAMGEKEQDPLKLDNFASELWYNHEFIIDGTILDIRGFDKPERTYDIQINSFFKPEEGTNPKLITVNGSPNFYNIKGDRGIFFIKKVDSQWEFGEHAAKITSGCLPEMMYHNPPLIDPPLVRGPPPTDFGMMVDCYPHYYKKYLPQYMKARGAIEFPSPRTQSINGVLSQEIVCNGTLNLVQKHDGSPACVTPETKENLIERGWTEPLQINVHRTPETVYIGPTDIPSANNQFALRFYSQISENDKESNIFFSPSSIFTAFAIAYEGARGNTATEMQQVFGFEKDDSKRKAGFAEMQELLNPQDEEYVLNIANALWLAKGFETNPEYSKTVKTHYDSNVESVDFTSEKDGLNIINQWVDEKTNGKIEKIFEELDPQTKLAITNAIHFKGDWAEPFDKEKTTDGSFYINEKTTIQVPMMELKTTYLDIARQDNVWILELPYEGEKLSMLILLPNEVNGIKSLEESLSKKNLDEWKNHLQQSKVKVHMPKFKLETHYDMVTKLQDMGIHDAFGNADFSGISDSGLHIYKAVHKAFVDVNEEGTEAAAATGMAMLESGPMPFTVNHPFVFLIQDNGTGQILFMGRVMDPTA